MTIAASGPLRSGAIRTEYGGTTPMRLGNYRRGHASGWVKKNAANNVAVNMSAAVGETTVRMGQFRGQAKGWTFTNATNRIVSAGHYYVHTEFGDDWQTNVWPCFYINNATMGSTSPSYLPVVINGRTNGPFTFTNNSEIQGGGGQPNSGGGQHAIYIQATVAGANRPIIVNKAGAAIRGGGGAGGIGGTGGTGGQGYYVATGQEGPTYTIQSYEIYIYPGGPHGMCRVWWAGTLLYQAEAPPYDAVGISGYTYYQGARRGGTAPDYNHYEVRRTWPYNVVTAGGGGGGGGNGGRGIGYNSPNLGGNSGAGGAAGGTNAGAGGTGGTGGTGGSWGAVGNTGNTGAGGGYGNYQGWGPGGAAGAAGGAGGYSIYAVASAPWGLSNAGTLNGSYGGGTAPS